VGIGKANLTPLLRASLQTELIKVCPAITVMGFTCRLNMELVNLTVYFGLLILCSRIVPDDVTTGCNVAL
jgi:hypothetical protein